MANRPRRARKGTDSTNTAIAIGVIGFVLIGLVWQVADIVMMLIIG